jgi:L-2,4-diaminobutyrate transaminase
MAEPVLGTGGLVPPPEGYWEAIQGVLKRYEVLLIADEVICGFGRLGAAFGSQVYGIEPDLITIGKGLTSGYLPLSGALIGEKVWRVLQDDGSDAFGIFGHGYTFSGHPLCASAALANLDVLEQEKLYDHVISIAPYFQQRLQETFSGRPYVAEVRCAGLLGAIEFARDPAKRIRFDPGLTLGPRLAAACLDESVIVRAMPHGDILGLAPPLIITKAEIDDVVTRVARAVERVTATL